MFIHTLVRLFLFAAGSLFMGWLFVDLSWAIQYFYFLVGACFFIQYLLGASWILTGQRTSFLERIHQAMLRRTIAGRLGSVIANIYNLAVVFALSLVYWPVQLTASALLTPPTSSKLFDLQLFILRASAKRPFILAATMLLQNLLLVCAITIWPTLQASSNVRLFVQLAMIANLLFLVAILFYPIEAQIRKYYQPSETVKLFLGVLISLFLSNVLLLYCFRLMFDRDPSSMGLVVIDLLFMGGYNPIIAKLSLDIGALLSEGNWRAILTAIATVSFELWYSLLVCLVFGLGIATRGIGILFIRSMFARTEEESVSGALLALMANEFTLADRFAAGLKKIHYLHPQIEMQRLVTQGEFDKAIEKSTLLVRRKRHALELDDDVTLSARECWFILSNVVLSTDSRSVLIAFLVWSARNRSATSEDLSFVLQGPLLQEAEPSELKLVLYYAVGILESQGDTGPLVEWLRRKRDQLYLPGRAAESSRDEGFFASLINDLINNKTLESISKTRTFAETLKEWDDVVLAGLHPGLTVSVSQHASEFETLEPLDKCYAITFFKAWIEQARRADSEQNEAETEQLSEIEQKIRLHEVEVLNRYGESVDSLKAILGAVGSMK